MAKLAVETVFGNLNTYVFPTGTYDSTKLGLGTNMVQTGGYIGPCPIGLARPNEQSTAIPSIYPWAMQWSSTVDWVFLADNATAAATRRINMYTFNRSTGTFNWQGFITVTWPVATNVTITALRMTYDLHTTGTVAVSGTAVTGTSTHFSSDRACVGNRIGFGSTDPTQISTWYEISAIGSNTSITLTTSAGTISAGTPYVIEDLRCVTAQKNATATNGGLFVVKGLRPEIFTAGGTAIAAATTVDNIRASYWLADASTVTNTNASGLGIEPKTNLQTHIVWALDGTTTATLFKYNLRAALTLTAGKDTTTLALKTGASATLVGTASQANNLRYAVMNHGPGSGVGCLYFTTTTRIYRTIATSSITASMTTHLADAASEVPPGGTNTFAASSLLNSLEPSSAIDKFVVLVNSTTTPFRSYVTQYRTDAGQWDRLFLTDIRQIDQSTVDSGTTPTPSISSRAFSGWSENGILYLAGVGTTSLVNHLYALPIGADWEYASTTNSRIICPKMLTPNSNKYYRVYFTEDNVVGASSGQNLGVSTEPYRVYYRTTGIDDNSGGWTLLGDNGDLSSVAGAAAIQFMLEFKTIGLSCVPARILTSCVVYEDNATASNFQPSVSQSSITSKIFAWRFATAFGGTVPTLYLRLYDAVTGATLLTDNTVSAASGTWTKSTDGVSYGAYNSTDKANETTYIRYTPTSLADNIKVRAVLSTS